MDQSDPHPTGPASAIAPEGTCSANQEDGSLPSRLSFAEGGGVRPLILGLKSDAVLVKWVGASLCPSG
jgi:hypothetical protein